MTDKPSPWLDRVERLGNALPSPISLFAGLSLLVLVASAVAAWLGAGVHHPKDGAWIAVDSLLDSGGIRRVLTQAVKNFMAFAPLGQVLVAMMGVGLAERCGLLPVLLRATVLHVPARFLTSAIIFTGMLGHIGADAATVILPPLAALLFVAVGRHPLAGLAAAFAGTAGGFAANVLPTPQDILLVGFTQEAASTLLPGYKVQIIGNYWFLCVSAPVLTVVGTWVTHRFVEPRLGKWEGGGEAVEGLKAEEQRGLKYAGTALAVALAGIALLVVPAWAPLRGPGDTLLAQLAPFFDAFIMIIVLLFFLPGVAYGVGAGTIKSERDVSAMLSDTLATMGTYIALAFVAAQFVAWFNWSNLGPVVAISGASGLQAIGLTGPGLLVAFVLFCVLLDLVMPSMSAKWAVLAPVFVPMFVLLGYTPEATQVVYRVGDSVANVITPLMPYLPFLLACAQKYVKEAGVGTLMALMLPYSLVFALVWTVQILIFYTLGWPIGPGVGFQLPG